MIQAKFVEINQENGEELGFDWLLGRFNLPGTDQVSGGGPAAGSGGGTITRRRVPHTGGRQIVDSSFEFPINPLTSGLRSGADAIETNPIDGLLSEDTTRTSLDPADVGIVGVFTDPQFQVVMRALEQKEGTGLLSAPSVVTRSGQRAKIEIIREFIYPTEYDPPEIPQDFVTSFNYFNPGETQFNIAVGGALGNLSEITTATTTARGIQPVERNGTRQVQVGRTSNPNLNKTARKLNQVQQKLLNVTNPNQANRLLQQQDRLFRRGNRQFQNQGSVPVFQNQDFTVVENVPFEQELELMQVEGIMDENSPKLAVGFTHYLDNHFGIGGQFEWIQGNLSDGFLGQAEVTWREPIEFENLGLAPYVTGGIGGITGDAINEWVGSVAAGVEFRLQNDVGIYTEYSHNFLGNGKDFGQILAGINVVIAGKGVSRKPPRGGGGGRRSSFPAVIPATPTALDSRNLGVTLEVEPHVAEDGFTIDLDLAPELVEFEGFINYGAPISTDAVDADGNPVEVVLTESRIEMPIFKTRKAKTSVTMHDGQTVAIGGLIREDVQQVEDKVPFLGDIPLIGRLFRSRSEKHFKKNLTIFVSARLVDPEGQP